MWKCSTCGKEFRFEGGLDWHITHIHRAKDARRYYDEKLSSIGKKLKEAQVRISQLEGELAKSQEYTSTLRKENETLTLGLVNAIQRNDLSVLRLTAVHLGLQKK